jgi:SAM-dependent methyltransferase
MSERLGRGLDRVLSVGCSAGANEMHLYDLGLCREFVCVDISSEAIAKADGLKGDRNMRFAVMDLEKEILGVEEFDAVFCFSCLHHINNLGFVLDNIHRSLIPGGKLVVHDYEGASRFQWPKRAMDRMNDVYSFTPQSYRYNYVVEALVPWIVRPTVSAMICSDPSEAVRSGELCQLLDIGFEKSEEAFIFSPLLLYLFFGVMEHFSDDRELDATFLSLTGQIEDRLAEAGMIEPGGIAAIYTKRDAPGIGEAYRSDLERSKAVFDGENRLLELDGRLGKTESEKSNTAARLEETRRENLELNERIEQAVGRAIAVRTGLKWKFASGLAAIGRLLLTAGPDGTATGQTPVTVEASETLPASEYGSPAGKALARYIGGERTGEPWCELLADRDILPAGSWLVYGFEQPVVDHMKSTVLDAIIDVKPVGVYDCIVYEAAAGPPPGGLDLLAPEGCLVSVGAIEGRADDVARFKEEVLDKIPEWFSVERRPTTVSPATATPEIPSVPLKRVIRMGRLAGGESLTPLHSDGMAE